MAYDLHIAPENITYLYEFDLVLGTLIPDWAKSPKSERQQLDLIISVPLLNMTSAAPLSVVLSLLSQRKEGKRGRSVSHV